MLDILKQYSTEIISAGGAIGSLIGALIAWLQYRKASTSAKTASDIELRLMSQIKRKEMVREVQKIQSLVEKLSPYIQSGYRFSGLGKNIQQDLDSVIQFRNQLKGSSKYSTAFENELYNIFELATSTNFKEANENDRILVIKRIIELLNKICSEIDKEAIKND